MRQNTSRTGAIKDGPMESNYLAHFLVDFLDYEFNTDTLWDHANVISANTTHAVDSLAHNTAQWHLKHCITVTQSWKVHGDYICRPHRISMSAPHWLEEFEHTDYAKWFGLPYRIITRKEPCVQTVFQQGQTLFKLCSIRGRMCSNCVLAGADCIQTVFQQGQTLFKLCSSMGRLCSNCVPAGAECVQTVFQQGQSVYKLCSNMGRLCSNCVPAGSDFVQTVFQQGQSVFKLCSSRGRVCSNCVPAGAECVQIVLHCRLSETNLRG